MGSRAKFRLESESSQVSMCPSCENEYCEVSDQVPELGPRRMTKYSISESLIAPSQYSELQKQYSEIVLSYHKLKISFTVMLILNAILLVVVITCMVFIIPHISSNQASNSNTKTETSKLVERPVPPTGVLPTATILPRNPTEILAINCQSIQSKLGRVYINGQKVDDITGKTCTVGDLIDSIKQYMESSTDKKKRKAAVHFTAANTHLTQCNRDSKMFKCLKHWTRNWGTVNVNVNDDNIVIPETGVYFIYNRVYIKMDVANATMIGDIDHMLRHSNTGSEFKDLESSKIACVVTNHKFNHVSYIEKVQHLEQGDELKVALKLPSNRGIRSIQSSSSFGMFQL